MDDTTLLRELHFLGVDEHTWPVLAMLPLIEVAWADGEVQPAERALILSLADAEYGLDPRGHEALENWLSHRPTAQYLLRGREAVRLLTERSPELADASGVLGHAEAVARAAGGLFGFASVDANERAVLERLAETLHVAPQEDWTWRAVDDDDLTQVEGPGGRGTPRVQWRYEPAETPGDGAPRLRRLDADVTYAVPPGGLTVGRSRTNDLQIRGDGLTSRRHCRVYVEGDTFWVEDNQATAGTLVNGERVVRRRLFGGEEIRVGDQRLRFETDPLDATADDAAPDASRDRSDAEQDDVG